MSNEYRFVNLLGGVGRIRREQLNGREHIVVPVVALVEGAVRAMNAKGYEMVRAEKFGKAPGGWNGRPLFAGHPVSGRTPISGNDPRVLERSFGKIFNTHVDERQRLCMEAWIDPVKAASDPASNRVLERVLMHEAGDAAALPLETSVGAFVGLAAERGTWKNRAYEGAWDLIMPDHLAFLAEDQVGACSVAMGCGALRAAMLTDEGMQALEGEDEIEAALEVLGDKPGHEFHGNQYTSGQAVRFDGKSVTGDVEGVMPVTIVNPHSNAHLVDRLVGNGKRQRAYDKEGRQHIPTATVKNSRGKEFEVYHYTLRTALAFNSDQPRDDGKLTARQRAARKGSGMLGKLKQRALEFLRLAQSPDEMSDRDLRMKLAHELREAVPGFVDVEAMWPVMNPTRVVYSLREPSAAPGFADPYAPSGNYEYCTEERTFTLSDQGEVEIGETAVRVQMAMYWEPVDPAEEDMRGLAARLHALAGDPDADPREAAQAAHAAAVALGALCAEPRIAEAHECACRTKPESQENNMDRKQKIAALAAHQHSAIKDLKVLEGMTDAALDALGTAADAAQNGAAALKAAQDALASPVAEDRLPEEYRAMMTERRTADAAEAAGIVTELKAAQTAYTEEELKALSLSELRKLASVARIAAPAAPSFAGRVVPRVAAEGPSFAPPDAYATQLKALQQPRTA